jgi:hypothetical protein
MNGNADSHKLFSFLHRAVYGSCWCTQVCTRLGKGQVLIIAKGCDAIAVAALTTWLANFFAAISKAITAP